MSDPPVLHLDSLHVPLREWIEALIDGLRASAEARFDTVDARFVASDKAVERASAELTIRLDHSNGLIEQMREQQKQSNLQLEKLSAEFARRIDLGHVEKRVDALERVAAHTAGSRHGGQMLRDVGMVVLGAAMSYAAMRLAQ